MPTVNIAMSTDSVSTAPILNRTELQERMLGSTEMAAKMLNKFLESASTDCDLLESSVRMGDKAAVAFLAHRHRGTAETLATHRVAELARQMEHRAASDPTSELLDMVQQMRRLHQEVRDVVGQEFSGNLLEQASAEPKY